MHICLLGFHGADLSLLPLSPTSLLTGLCLQNFLAVKRECWEGPSALACPQNEVGGRYRGPPHRPFVVMARPAKDAQCIRPACKETHRGGGQVRQPVPAGESRECICAEGNDA